MPETTVNIPRTPQINQNFGTLRDVSSGYEGQIRNVYRDIGKDVLKIDDAILNLSKAGRSLEEAERRTRQQLTDLQTESNAQQEELSIQFDSFQKSLTDRFNFQTEQGNLQYEEAIGRIDQQQSLSDINRDFAQGTLANNRQLLQIQEEQRLSDLNSTIQKQNLQQRFLSTQLGTQAQRVGIAAGQTGQERTQNTISQNFNQVQKNIVQQQATIKNVAERALKGFLGFGASNVFQDNSFNQFLQTTGKLSNVFREQALLKERARSIELRALSRNLNLTEKATALGQKQQVLSVEQKQVQKNKELLTKSFGIRQEQFDLKEENLKNIYDQQKLFRDTQKKFTQSLFLLSQNFQRTTAENQFLKARNRFNFGRSRTSRKVARAERDQARQVIENYDKKQSLKNQAQALIEAKKKYEELLKNG